MKSTLSDYLAGAVSSTGTYGLSTGTGAESTVEFTTGATTGSEDSPCTGSFSVFEVPTSSILRAMSFQIFEDIISLLCTILGLLFCISKYTETHRRVYLYLLVFFLANFLSEYYWTIYELVMRDYPDVSMFVAYLGWNIGYVFLFLTQFSISNDEAKRYFHPIMLLPVLLNIPQFILYISFGGILNNIWEVGVTTITMVFCLQDIVYYVKNRGNLKIVPWFSILVLAYLTSIYVTWTSSCFDWRSEVQSPYLYFSVINSLLLVFFTYGAEKHYGGKNLVRNRKALLK
jgi:hypothetical protein